MSVFVPDDDNIDLTLRNSDSEADEDMTEQEEQRRLQRLEREKWLQGETFFNREKV